jgi:hypothetical protein
MDHVRAFRLGLALAVLELERLALRERLIAACSGDELAAARVLAVVERTRYPKRILELTPLELDDDDADELAG